MTVHEYIYAGFIAVVLVVFAWRVFRCCHAWELIENAELPPPILAAKESGFPVHLLSYERAERMCKKTLVMAIRCGKCGATRIEKIIG